MSTRTHGAVQYGEGKRCSEQGMLAAWVADFVHAEVGTPHVGNAWYVCPYDLHPHMHLLIEVFPHMERSSG
eukprot:44445-Eustigmatos_ZCMA.PRE.1